MTVRPAVGQLEAQWPGPSHSHEAVGHGQAWAVGGDGKGVPKAGGRWQRGAGAVVVGGAWIDALR